MDGEQNEETRRALLARAVGHRWVVAASHMPVAGAVARDGDAFAFAGR
jgi:hypothetical protein